MTDTTGIKALREGLVELLDHVDSCGGKCWLFPEDVRSIISSLDQLEAERQRADHNKVMQLAAEDVSASALRDWSSEGIKLHAANEEIKRLTAELAELKGDQVPVGWIKSSPNEAVSWDSVDPIYLAGSNAPVGWRSDYKPVYNRPQKPVVLPKSFIQSDYLSHGLEFSDAYGLSYGSSEMRALCKKAIEAAGCIVKDGE